MKRVAVIGGGAAGIAAALTAARKGAEVALYEAKPRLGGRLSSFTDGKTGWTFNNGEHMITGGYTATLKLLDEMGAVEAVELQERLAILFYHPLKGRSVLKASGLPAPFNLWSAVDRFNLLSSKAKRRLKGQILRLLLSGGGIKAAEFGRFIDWNSDEGNFFWRPFVVSSLNIAPEAADWRVVRTALKEGFLLKGGLGFFKRPLSEVFHYKASEALRAAGIEIKLKSEVRRVEIRDDRAVSLTINDIETAADYYIFALPPEALRKVFSDKINMLGGDLWASSISYSPILGVHLAFSRRIFPDRFGCLLESLPQWFFEAGWNQKEGEGCGYSLVISAADKYLKAGMEVLSVCLEDLRRCGGIFCEGELIFSKVVRVNSATVRLTPDFCAVRPGMRTGLSNVLLAGDWTDTGLPATIESAVRSGVAAGEAALGIKN